MKDKISLLKELVIVRDCALNYDYVPGMEEAGKLINEILPDHMVITKTRLEELLNIYNGYSASNITDEMINIIDEI